MWNKIKNIKIRHKTISVIFAAAIFASACIEPFSPPETNSDERNLVVDGFLNLGDTSVIELRHTQNTHDVAAQFVETRAKLSVKAGTGETYDFIEYGAGKYILPPKNFKQSGTYQLSIRTSGGKEYLSDPVSVILTPAIDSVTYRYDANRDAMVISVDTHDPKNNTRFYRWKFEETHQYRAAFFSGLMIDQVKKEIVSRIEDINLCWQTKKSGGIVLGSTIKLSSDVIKQLPINVVPISTNKFYIKYSILVKQYGLSREGFEYWTSLAKTTQGTGSLFDPLPSLVTGNIRSVSDPKELVFGFFSASTEAKKRIFMSPGLGRYPHCEAPDTLLIGDAIKDNKQYLLNYFGEQSEFVLSSSPGCTDCRTQGGTTRRPPFWE